ncbi:hypothetical protein B7988_12695 [Fibrobacter sp. UWB1]|uniref:hypothetical protein n=1 Tax=Fibrobacter sp. UWB1 TaxID=1964355 RepID=UPI000B52078B|nr:hypothetical protein [Fibrobacter sp. UWB1]OWV25083.1 hypothetical protein B7988_12695 [Fibrobacter sp. UWB1]
MEVEYNIAGRIMAKDGTRVISLAEILASPVAINEAAGAATNAADLTEETLTEDILAAYCKSVSAQKACKVYLWKDREEYGNANVFNGGSDYEVVNEICFLCIFDCGNEVARETTDHWNEKIDAVI